MLLLLDHLVLHVVLVDALSSSLLVEGAHRAPIRLVLAHLHADWLETKKYFLTLLA